MTDLRPAAPKTPKSAATRARLLAVAHDLFIEKGYGAASLADIASVAGLTKGAVYGHFRSKGQLLVEVIRTELAARDAADGDGEGGDLFGAFVAPGARELRILQIDAAAAARHDDDVASGMQELVEERLQWIAELSGQPTDPEAFAFVVAALALGVGVHESVGVEPPDQDAFAAALRPMFLAAYR